MAYLPEKGESLRHSDGQMTTEIKDDNCSRPWFSLGTMHWKAKKPAVEMTLLSQGMDWDLFMNSPRTECPSESVVSIWSVTCRRSERQSCWWMSSFKANFTMDRSGMALSLACSWNKKAARHLFQCPIGRLCDRKI